MTPDDCLRIRLSMDALRNSEQPFALLFYGKLFELDPSAKALFHNDLATQSAKLMTTLRVLCASLEKLETLLPGLEEMGRKHVQYGVRLEQYDSVTLALLWSFAHALGPDFDESTRRAWKLTIDAVCSAMKAGAAKLTPAIVVRDSSLENNSSKLPQA